MLCTQQCTHTVMCLSLPLLPTCLPCALSHCYPRASTLLFPLLPHREQLEAIAVVVREHPRLLVLSDEIYEYIIYKCVMGLCFCHKNKHSSTGEGGKMSNNIHATGIQSSWGQAAWRQWHMHGGSEGANP